MLADDEPTFGYLLILEDERHGWTGGYLVVSVLGRPIEFHCTEPVLPSRAEELLYGSTLRAHLLGERIGPALLEKASVAVDLLLVGDADGVEAGRRVGLTTVAVDALRDAEPDEVVRLCGEEGARRLERLADLIDVAEPFERVREAVLEAHRVGHEGETDDSLAA